MIDAEPLKRIDAEFRPLLLDGGQKMALAATFQWRNQALAVRYVRGRKMRTLYGVFDEFAAAFQFPLYFGENWGAFSECIRDLEYIPPGDGYVVVITEPDQVLVEEDDRWLRSLVGTLRLATEEFADPLGVGNWFDRAPVPFHVVLALDAETRQVAVDRWSAAGVEPVNL